MPVVLAVIVGRVVGDRTRRGPAGRCHASASPSRVHSGRPDAARRPLDSAQGDDEMITMRPRRRADTGRRRGTGRQPARPRTGRPDAVRAADPPDVRLRVPRGRAGPLPGRARPRPVAIGAVLTLTLIGDTVISLWLTTHADRLGRRRVLIVGSLARGRRRGRCSPRPVGCRCSSSPAIDRRDLADRQRGRAVPGRRAGGA